MGDQSAAVNEQQPTVDTPDTGTDTPTAPSENWEDRYKEAQAWGTQGAQWRAQHESTVSLVAAAESGDPEAQRALIERMGLQLSEPEPDEDTQQYSQLDPQLRAELDELKQWRESTRAEQEREANYAEYRTIVDPQMKELGVPEAWYDVVSEAALNLPVIQTPQGPQPDLQAAFHQMRDVLMAGTSLPEFQTAVKKSWQNQKPRAAITQHGGAEGTSVPDLTDGEQRRAWINSRLAGEA